MLRLAAIAIIGALSATAAAQGLLAFDRPSAPSDQSALRPAEAASSDASADQATPATSAEGDAAMVTKGPDGHYWAEAVVDGHPVRFLVDTGASAVALTADDARRLGFAPESLNYGYQVNTANGVARAAKVTLGSVSVAGAEVDNVDAFVIENGLATSLLGMTYLGRLSQFEATPTSLTLKP